jgi:bifunctional non-homologous end joining protein LigD
MGLEDYRKKRHFDKTPEPTGGTSTGSPDVVAGEDGDVSTATAAAALVTVAPVAGVALGSAASAGSPSERGFLYVIQKHASRRLHYDFRLELDGVLVSWAVPKGPSLNPKDRRLAVRVEDHPYDYGAFEGIIPEGQYGAGTVQLWDRGTWEPEGDAREGLSRGSLKFTLHGEKLKGGWALVRMKARPGEGNVENWLLIKHRDDEAVPGDGEAVLRDHDRSVVSGRTVEDITAAP